jgi:hypothetical protein
MNAGCCCHCTPQSIYFCDSWSLFKVNSRSLVVGVLGVLRASCKVFSGLQYGLGVRASVLSLPGYGGHLSQRSVQSQNPAARLPIAMVIARLFWHKRAQLKVISEEKNTVWNVSEVVSDGIAIFESAMKTDSFSPIFFSISTWPRQTLIQCKDSCCGASESRSLIELGTCGEVSERAILIGGIPVSENFKCTENV